MRRMPARCCRRRPAQDDRSGQEQPKHEQSDEGQDPRETFAAEVLGHATLLRRPLGSATWRCGDDRDPSARAGGWTAPPSAPRSCRAPCVAALLPGARLEGCPSAL